MLPFELSLRTGAEQLRLRGAVPEGDIRLLDVLPMLQQLDDLIVDAAVREDSLSALP